MPTKKDIYEPTPFALGLDGAAYLNVFALDGIDTLEQALGAVKNKKFFLGVPLTRAEVARLLPFLRDGGCEAAGYIAGGRHWRKKA